MRTYLFPEFVTRWERTPHRILLLVFAIHIGVWSIINQFVNLHPDYIDHWMQSRIWSLSYFEHPPMVAVLIRFLTFFFGYSELGLEAAALLVDLLIIGFAYYIALFLYGQRAGVFTLLGLEATPFFVGKSASIQTEQPLLLFWLAAILALLVYQKTNKARWILLAGVFAGFGALSKYHMIFFYIGIFVYFTLVSTRRKEWINPWQYLGGIIALIIFSPVIYWNYINDWSSFLFQLEKGSIDQDKIYGAMSLEFMFGTFMVYSFVLVGWGGWRIFQRIRQGDLVDKNGKLGDSPNTLLIVLYLIPILFFIVVLFRADYVDPQGTSIAMILFFIWLGGESSRLWDEGKSRALIKIYSVAFFANIILLGIAFFHIYSPILDYPISRDPAYPVIGWDDIGKKVEQALNEKAIPLPDYVVTNEYSLGSQFALHLSSNPRTYSTGRVLRNLWSDPRKMNKKNTIFVCDTPEDCDDLIESSGETIGFIIYREELIRHAIRGRVRNIAIYRIAGKDFSLLDEEEMDLRLADLIN